VSRKFAQITANILARKGEAEPSLTEAAPHAPSPQPVPAPPHFSWATELSQAFVADITSGKPVSKKSRRVRAKLPADANTRRVFLKISLKDNERLEIAALKKGTRRNALIHAALIDYLDALTREFADSCGCIAGEPKPDQTCCMTPESEVSERRRA
jgi:hypothetical protein